MCVYILYYTYVYHNYYYTIHNIILVHVCINSDYYLYILCVGFFNNGDCISNYASMCMNVFVCTLYLFIHFTAHSFGSILCTSFMHYFVVQELAGVQCKDIDENMLPALESIVTEPSRTGNFKLYVFFAIIHHFPF